MNTKQEGQRVTAEEMRKRFPRVDEVYARRHGLETLARRYNGARATLDPNAPPEIQAKQVKRAQSALDAVLSAHAAV